jgi:glycosyltransferase involved in cell wall biosynthesis
VVHDGITGYLALPGDPQSVAEGTLRLLDSPRTMKAMGEAANQLARQRFSSERFARDVANLFDMLLQRRVPWRKGSSFSRLPKQGA